MNLEIKFCMHTILPVTTIKKTRAKVMKKVSLLKVHTFAFIIHNERVQILGNMKNSVNLTQVYSGAVSCT